MSWEIVSADFWEEGCLMLMIHTCGLLERAGYKLSADAIINVVESMPLSPEQAANPDWPKSSFCGRCLQRAQERGKRADLNELLKYFLLRIPQLSVVSRRHLEASVRGVLRGLDVSVGEEGQQLVITAREELKK